jgi:hypothetical protein
METLVQRPQIQETYDPEIRRYNDTVTWLAEVLDGSMRTPFEYRFDGRDLIADDGSRLGKIFEDSIKAAENMPPHLKFELRRRRIEQEEYEDMLRMMRSERPNTMIVVSDFPPELMIATESVGGYNVARKQTMLRAITCTPEGRLHMRSQSLDLSDRRALVQLYRSLGFEPAGGELLGQRMHLELSGEDQEFVLDRLMGTYDRMLSAQYGGEWYAGQQNGMRTNTFDFVRSQHDLLETYFHFQGRLGDNRITRELAAAMKLRYEGRGNVHITDTSSSYLASMNMEHIRMEMFGAGKIADDEGTDFFGCGLGSRARTDNGGESQMNQLGYGNKSDTSSSEKLVWKDGVCRIDGCPTRPGKTKVAQCSICRGCQAWFDKGRDPAKLYKSFKPVQKNTVNLQFNFSADENEKADKAWLN